MNLSTAAIYISTENLEIDYSRSERENSAQIEQEKEAALSEDNNIFEYQGYHFKPIGNFLSKDDFNSLSRNIVSHSSPYMSVYEDSEIAYFRNDFYRASNNSKADVFLCVETGKIFTPGENMLFEFTGEHEPIPEIEKTVLSEEQQENAAEPKAETGLSDNSMPDISITADDRNKYGYTSDDLLPLNTEKALELFDKGVPVYLLYIDNTEALAENRAEIESFDGIFGIEVGEWEKSLQIEQTRNNKKETELLHQPAISKNDVQIEQNKTDDRTASPKSSENTVSKPLKQTQQEQKTERKKGIIGNTTYRYIPKKRYRKFDVDTAEKIADAFEKAGLKYSGVVGESTTTLTFSGNDIEKAETIIEQVKNNESAKENTNAVENISSTSETSKSKTAKNSKVENKEKEAAPTITLEDIDSVLKNGSGFKSGKYRIYRQFQKQEKSKANTDFLKKEYGTGSGTHNFSDGIQGWTNFDTKGISITKYGDYDNPDVKLNWSQAEKQIKKLISEDRYFTDEDNKKYPEYLKSVNAPQYEIDNFIKSVHQKFIQSKSKLPPAEKRDSLSLRLSDFIRYLDGYEQGLLKEVGRTDLANISADEMETRLSEPETVQQLLDFLKKVQGATSDAYSRSNAWYFRQELSQLYPMQYICKADDIVYIDSEKYEVLEADNNNFILRNAEMALDTRTLSFDELQKQLSGNTANDIYKRVIPENSTQNIAQNQQINIASAPTVEQSQNKAANINVNSILGQSFSQNIIDLFLQQGSNTDNARMVIATEFMKQKPIEEIAESLKTVYHGGFGIQAGNRAVSAWYDEDGIHLSAGKTARYNRNAQVISWVEAAERIGQLLNEGTFESNVELAEADGYEREQLAEKVLHLYRDISDEGKEQNLFLSLKTALSGVSAGFPEQKSFLKAKLDDSEFRKALSADFDVFKTAYNQDRNVLRFHYHKVDSIDRDLKELELPRIGFESNMTAVPAVNEFITDDEINADLARGSGVEGGKGRIYNYFTKNHTLQEKADYIKNEYGIGGHSHALSGSTGSDQWHDSKGINYKKKNCKDVKMSWSQAAKRISEIIEKNNYLSKEEKNLPKEKPDKEQEISIEPPLRNNVNNDITEEKSHDNGIDEAVQNKTESTSYIPIYKNTGKYAAENNEMDMFRASNKENRKCREAIENAIKENFNGMYLDPKAVDGVIDKFGTDRVSYLLAATIKAKKDYDKRFSNSNIKWADSVDTSFRRPDSFSEIISSHSAILDGFIRLFRESIEKDRELAKPNKEKTFEDVAENVNKPVEYFTPTVKAVINDLSNSTDKRYYVRIWSSTDGKNYSDTGNGRYFNDLEMAKNFATEIIDGKYNDIIAFTAKYDEIYKELEDNPEKLNEYKVNGNDFDEAVNNDSYKYYLKYISVRGDDFTGDREQTAFVLALNEISRQKYLGSEKKEEAEAIAEPITDTVKEKIADKPENFRITDYDFTSVKPRDKFRDNVNAIRTLFAVESENRQATPEEQEILSKYVGWGGLADAFDAGKYSWISEYNELKNLLPEKQYNSARASVTDSFYTPPVVISSIYKALKNVGFEGGRILEPSMGVGNFFGMLPEDLRETSKLYGVEIDDISGRIAKLLYPNANIQIKGFEDTSFNSNSFDLAVGNVPFGNIRITDRDFKERNLIHDYFFKKSLDRVRPGGVVAFITSKGTLDKKDNSVRKYLAERADLIGAIRLPDNVFKRNAGTEVTSDIIFLQKREFPRDLEKEPLPDWVNVSANLAGIEMNSYFIENPQMVLGEMQEVSGRFGTRVICSPYENADLSELLDEAVSHIKKIEPNEIIDEVTVENTDISQNDIITENASGNETVSESQNLADDNDNKAVSENKDNDGPSTVFEDEDFENEVDPMGHRNFCYDIVDGKIYFRENDMMKKQDLKSFHTKDAFERLSGMIEISKCLQELIRFQLENYEDEYIVKQQKKLNKLYDDFTAKYGLLSSRSNKNIFKDDDTAPLLQSLENLNEKGELESKADIFTKRTIIPYTEITSVDTASEALAVSISEKAKVDLDFMSELCSKPKDEIVNELEGVIFENPFTKKYETADEYLSGNVRKKLADTEKFVKVFKEQAEKYTSNIEALKKVQPADLLPSEIFVQLGSTWIPPKYYEEFMYDLLETPDRCKSDNISFCNRNPFLSSGRHSSRSIIAIDYNEHSATFAISNKSNYAADSNNMLANKTYGTDRKNAYQILEDSLNMKQVKIFDYYEDIDGKKKAVLNQKETILAQNKQTLIKNKFKEWIFDDAKRTKELCRLYNDKFNCDNPRQYNGEHINFVGMNPEITLREHQRNAIAHTLYGGNTLLAHVVGSGKTYEMVASAMESKRLGLCHKSLIVVPKAIVNQFAKEFMQLYPAANILVPGENDFSEKNRRKFCSRISTGNYDAIIISHNQFERIPLSKERQIEYIQNQIDEIIDNLEELKRQKGERGFTVKELESTKKNLQNKLKALNNDERRDTTITFEELGVDKLYVDEAHMHKNLFFTSKMGRNVAGVNTSSNSQRATDLQMKCQYLDEITGSKGVVFATGTPVSNSIAELFTMQRYLQNDKLKELHIDNFDSWASTYAETKMALELAPEGKGYQMKTRFAKFSNLPELMNMFKEIADVKTGDVLNLPVPEAHFHTISAEASQHQKDMVDGLAKRAEKIRNRLVDPTEDNMLAVTNDGRKLALDQRLMNPLLPDEPNSKINMCVENVFKIWQDEAENKSTQIIFSDLSTPNTTGFNVYDDIKKKLIDKGIPQEQIAFIHDCKTDVQKQNLFTKVNNGEVRVLLGSTSKLGTGVNCQKRLKAAHHVDCPWKPADLARAPVKVI
ncbi:MAG: DUF3849 domain-containing protein [Clostridiales bacterium]|nr:DUF3849 domain-containing protein [Clostridiales bacterium]